MMIMLSQPRCPRVLKRVLLCLFTLGLAYIMISSMLMINPLQYVPHNMTSLCQHVSQSYIRALKGAASEEKVLMLAMLDKDYIDMVLNFKETSLDPLALTNVLFIAPDEKTCDLLRNVQMKCHVYSKGASIVGNGEAPSGDGYYGSVTFNNKMVLRTYAIIDALVCGYTVLHSDVDMHYFKDPFPHFKCADCDIEALEDGWPENLNAGFAYLKPTPGTVAVYRMCLDAMQHTTRTDDQIEFNNAIIALSYAKVVKAKALDVDKFICGVRYYEEGSRYFTSDISKCEKCVVVHNNWIVSHEAKVYRAKETGMWLYDHNEYFTATNRKYLTFTNNIVVMDGDGMMNEEATNKLEKSSLVSALAIGRILNRTVILPKFHCFLNSSTCPLNSLYRIDSFNKAFGNYRESSFLNHSKVPQDLKSKTSVTFLIESPGRPQRHCSQSDTLTTFIPKDTKEGATSEEITQWLKPYHKHPVLYFDSLYNAFSRFADQGEEATFQRDISRGIVPSVYRQYVGETRSWKRRLVVYLFYTWRSIKRMLYGIRVVCL